MTRNKFLTDCRYTPAPSECLSLVRWKKNPKGDCWVGGRIAFAADGDDAFFLTSHQTGPSQFVPSLKSGSLSEFATGDHVAIHICESDDVDVWRADQV